MMAAWCGAKTKIDSWRKKVVWAGCRRGSTEVERNTGEERGGEQAREMGDTHNDMWIRLTGTSTWTSL